MELSTTEKIMKVWGWISLVILILGIPAQFVNKYLLKMEFEPSVLIMFVISSVFEMLLSIAFIRCKKDLFLVAAMGCQVLYRLIVIFMNLSTVSSFTFINLAIYISLLGLVAVNCVPKLSENTENRRKTNKVWFLPSVTMLFISIIGFIKDVNEKFPDTIVNNVQDAGTEIAVQTFSLGISVLSTILGILPYLLLSYWIYKSYKEETEFE
ncbi:MAG: hypothetical protein IJN49_04300 [Clostridia bacterium]|nr:hypothetical protein [Clostridia bacterium]